MEKLDVELDIIKCKIHKEDLQDDFKERLEEKLNSACEPKLDTTVEDVKNRISRPFYFHKAVAAVFVCIFVFSSYAFAGGVGDWIKEMFCNVDKEMEVAYENGDIKQVNTEYQTYDGVSVKVDYVSLKDNELYVVFNVKSEEEYSYIDIKDVSIEDKFGNIISNNIELNDENNKYDFNFMEKGINTQNKIIFLTVTNKENNFKYSEDLELIIKNMEVSKNNITENVNGDWKFEIDFNQY